MHRPVPQKRPPAFDNCGVVDAAAAGQSHQLDVARLFGSRPPPAAVQRTHQRLGRRRHRQALAVSVHAATELGEEHHLGHGLPDPTAGGDAAAHLGHHHREVGAAAGEVAGAVHRVDHPGELGGRQLPKWRRVGVHAFFTHHEAAGVFAPEDVGQRSFCQPVGHRDQVTRALLDDLVIGQGLKPGHDLVVGHLPNRLDHRLAAHQGSRVSAWSAVTKSISFSTSVIRAGSRSRPLDTWLRMRRQALAMSAWVRAGQPRARQMPVL